MDKIEDSSKEIQLNQKEVKEIKQILDDMLDFLAEMPVNKYHDYREFRNIQLREYLIHKFVKNNYERKVTWRKNN